MTKRQSESINYGEEHLKRLNKILDSLKDKVFACNGKDLSTDIIDFTHAILDVRQSELDVVQNERLIKIEKEYYSTIIRFEDKCTCKPK